MTARVLVGGSEVRPEKALKSGHDRSAFVELASAQEPLSFACRNCHIDWPEPFCDLCGAHLLPVAA